VLSPVLLVGGGGGEATCGILYLAGFLRRNGVEAFVRLYDADESDEDVTRSIESLVAFVRPRLVGVSLKWYHHAARALLIAQTVRRCAPDVRVVFGGNTAAHYWRELIAYDCVDHVVLGDGEAPLLALCRGDDAAPNCATRAAGGSPARTSFGYVQGASSGESFYSHFDDVFLSQLDQHSFSGWVAPGKGCGDTCLYCGGGRGTLKTSFGRAQPFLRPEETVRRDHAEVAPRVWQLRYDFYGGTAEYLTRTWAGFDLSSHSTTYFLWGVPDPALVDALAQTFRRVYLVLDVGCFSEAQRQELMRRRLIKPCPSDSELLAAVGVCLRHKNLELEVCGIAGLPFTSAHALGEERRLVERLLAAGCAVGYQRLEAQPGAPVTEHSGRFEMATEARTFGEYLAWFSQPDKCADGAVPMVRFRDRATEQAVQRHFDQLAALARPHAATPAAVNGRTRLVTSVASTRVVTLGDWLGRYRVSARAVQTPVIVLRTADGNGLACAPSLDAGHLADPMLQQGPDGSAILSALDAFAHPATVAAVVTRLRRELALDSRSAREVVAGLVAGRFLQPA
jgi:hypothetical protein